MFWANPLVATIMTIGLILLFWPLISALKEKLFTGKALAKA